MYCFPPWIKTFAHRLVLGHIVLLVIILSGCTTVARFTDRTPIKAPPGATDSFTLNVSNWSDEHSLTLMNGGPYVENSIHLPIAVRFIQRQGQTVFAVDDNNDLHVINFAVKPAKQVLQAPLDDTVTALAVTREHILVAFEKLGVARINISGSKTLRKTAISPVKDVSRIRIDDKYAYLLAKDKIIKAPLDQYVSSPDKTEQWSIPASSKDFALHMDLILLTGPEFGLGVIKQSDTSTFLSTLQLQGSAHQIELSNNTVFIADGEGGMVLVDIEDSANPRWTGSHNKLPSIQKILTNEKQAIVIDRNVRLSSISVNNQELPITGSFYQPEGKVHDAVLADSSKDSSAASVYVATSMGVEQIIFPNQSHGQISNEGINQGGTRRGYIDGKLAYVADWFSGLHIYDISNPSRIKHIGNMHTPGSSKGVVVEDGYAYVGDDDYGLQIVDVSNPAKPVIVGSVATTGLAYTLKKRGELIFLADHRGGFHIINVKNVNKPFIVASHNTQGKSWAIDVKDNIVFVADDTSGLLVFDISELKSPRQIGQFDPQGQAEDVVIRDNFAYVSFFDRGLYILDVSNPTQPKPVSHLPIPGNARSIVLQKQYAYIAGWESGLQVVDISNVESPKIVGSYDTRGSAWGADINGSHAYVWDWWGGVKVIDVSNPEKPVLKSRYHAASKINKLRQKNNFIYTANHAAGVQVFDINNVLNPIWSTGTDIDGNVLDVWPSENLPLLFAVSDTEGLLVFDISDPFYIYLLDQYSIEGSATMVREDNGQVFVATANNELLLFSINDNNRLSRTQSLKLDVNDLWIDGKTLYVASSSEGLLTLPIDLQSHVKPHKKIIDEKVFMVGASEKYIAAATVNYGVDLWKRTAKGIAPVTNIDIQDKILGLALQDTLLLVLTPTLGLLHYEISTNDAPKLIARYPVTDHYSEILLHNNAVFFAGQDTVASVQLLPKLQWMSVESNTLEIKLSDKLPVGSYHLAVTDLRGNEDFWPNALSIQLKKSTKPKISIEDFQKLLEQHRKNQ